jgi:hypothetical protein
MDVYETPGSSSTINVINLSRSGFEILWREVHHHQGERQPLLYGCRLFGR